MLNQRDTHKMTLAINRAHLQGSSNAFLPLPLRLTILHDFTTLLILQLLIDCQNKRKAFGPFSVCSIDCRYYFMYTSSHSYIFCRNF